MDYQDESSTRQDKKRRRNNLSLLDIGDSAQFSGRFKMARFGIIMAVGFVLASLVIYGVNVHYSVKLNKISKSSRDLHEENKELHVNLNRLMSYKNLQTSVEKVPYLTESSERIKINNLAHPKLPVFSIPEPVYPEVYGY